MTIQVVARLHQMVAHVELVNHAGVSEGRLSIHTAVFCTGRVGECIGYIDFSKTILGLVRVACDAKTRIIPTYERTGRNSVRCIGRADVPNGFAIMTARAGRLVNNVARGIGARYRRPTHPRCTGNEVIANVEGVRQRNC